MLRVAGQLTDGTILWMGNEQAIESHVAPRLREAAAAAGEAGATHRGRAAGRGAR